MIRKFERSSAGIIEAFNTAIFGPETGIFGIGRTTAKKLCDETGINPDTRVRDLTDSEVNKIRMFIENNLSVEGDRRRNVQTDIKRKIEIGSYQGTRHRKGLPVRG
ncbi:MAG: 30S ribosomal protein S13, partial [Rhodobacteraceae bacterium]|nr:30S ribosomal protein S13 [Paracoccaceae bacterium]